MTRLPLDVAIIIAIWKWVSLKNQGDFKDFNGSFSETLQQLNGAKENKIRNFLCVNKDDLSFVIN